MITYDSLFTEEELLKELEEAREARRAAERHREELVKNAKQMQNKTQNRRNHGKPSPFKKLEHSCKYFFDV